MHSLLYASLLRVSVVLWFAALSSSGEINFVLILIVWLLAVWLIAVLVRRVRRQLLLVLKAAVFLGMTVLLLANEPLRGFLRQLIEETLAMSRERLYVWALLSTLAYGVLCLAQPAPATHPR